MYAFKLTLAALSLAVAACLEASTGAVKVEFLGASGKMKLYPASDASGKGGTFVEVSQEKLQEMNGAKKASGAKTSLNVAGQNSWTPLEKKGDSYDTTFTTADGDKTFALTSHLAQKTTTVVDVVPCNNCTSGAGSCKDTASGVCAEPGLDGNCPVSSNSCTASNTAYQHKLKFSFVVSGWQFLQASNTLQYGLVIKSKGNNKLADKDGNHTVTPENEKATLALEGGFFELPTVAIIKGGEADRRVNVTVTTTVVKDSTYVDFSFPSFGANEALYYDPDVTVNEANSDASGARSSLGTSVEAATLLALMSAAVFHVY